MEILGFGVAMPVALSDLSAVVAALEKIRDDRLER